MVTSPLATNLLVRLGITCKEDIISNLLADLLQEPSFLDRWLAFAGLPLVGSRKIEVRTRISAEGNIPDLAVLVGEASEAILLVIENKILATEGTAQTKRYSEPKTIQGLGKAFGIEGMTKDSFKGLYLSLHDEGSKDGFQCIQYGEITAWLRELSCTTSDAVRKLMAQDLAQLIEHFHTQDWTGQDALLTILDQDPCVLGKNFVAFQRIFQDALRDLPKAMEKVARQTYFWRGSGQGHGYYGGCLETDCATDGWYVVLDDAESNKLWSTTHIEFQYAHASKNLKLALHFETCPYKPEKQQEVLFKGREHLREPHARARAKVVDTLRAATPQGWKLDDRFLQIAYAQLEVKPDTTISEFQTQVRALVDVMIPVLDNAWKEVHK